MRPAVPSTAVMPAVAAIVMVVSVAVVPAAIAIVIAMMPFMEGLINPNIHTIAPVKAFLIVQIRMFGRRPSGAGAQQGQTK